MKTNVVGEGVGQMGLVNNAENLIGSLKGESHESTIFDHEDLVLRIADDGRLVLRDLDDSQAAELDDGIGN